MVFEARTGTNKSICYESDDLMTRQAVRQQNQDRNVARFASGKHEQQARPLIHSRDFPATCSLWLECDLAHAGRVVVVAAWCMWSPTCLHVYLSATRSGLLMNQYKSEGKYTKPLHLFHTRVQPSLLSTIFPVCSLSLRKGSILLLGLFGGGALSSPNSMWWHHNL